MKKEECIKKLEALDNIGKSVDKEIRGNNKKKEVIGEIEDLVSHIVDENRYEIQKIKLNKGGRVFRITYYICNANYSGLKFGKSAPIMKESDFTILIDKARRKGWLT